MHIDMQDHVHVSLESRPLPLHRTQPASGVPFNHWRIRSLNLTDMAANTYSAENLGVRLKISALARNLRPFTSLESFGILCGRQFTRSSFMQLQASVMAALGGQVALAFQYDPAVMDGRFLAPEMFHFDAYDAEQLEIRKCTL